MGWGHNAFGTEPFGIGMTLSCEQDVFGSSGQIGTKLSWILTVLHDEDLIRFW